MFRFRVRSIGRSSSTSAPAANAEARPWSPAFPVLSSRWIKSSAIRHVIINDMGDFIHVQPT
jgi:hypothetical protein